MMVPSVRSKDTCVTLPSTGTVTTTHVMAAHLHAFAMSLAYGPLSVQRVTSVACASGPKKVRTKWQEDAIPQPTRNTDSYSSARRPANVRSYWIFLEH